MQKNRNTLGASNISICLLIVVTAFIAAGIGYGIYPSINQETTTSTETKTVTVYQTRTVQPTTSPTETVEPEPPAQTGEWKTIEKFSGVDDKSTKDFYVTSNYWRVKYTVQAESEQYAAFVIIVYPADETESFTEMIDFDQSGTDISYIREGPGNFYLKIGAANLKSWTIEVQIQE